MSRPISPEPVFPDFWVSNIPRYFCFASVGQLNAIIPSVVSDCIQLFRCQFIRQICSLNATFIFTIRNSNFWPLLIWTLLPNLTFYLIVQGFHRTYATGAACQQRTLTPPDTWSCPTLGLACVLMSKPISPELVLSPDFWISNTPRYFSFACNKELKLPLIFLL